MNFNIKPLNPCFPEATSLANEPAMTPDSRADVGGFVAELILCLLRLYHKLAHCTRDNVNVSVPPLLTQHHKTL